MRCCVDCRRAAHFANYQADDEDAEENGNLHVGGNAVRTTSKAQWLFALLLLFWCFVQSNF